MGILSVFFGILGSLALFLYGMKVMSEGIQQAAGRRMQRTLSFMTGNRFSAVLTGLGVTAVIQSSSVTTVMVVSFVNAGLLTLTQAIGVIMGANIGTTVTAWVVSLAGFSLKIGAVALPLVGIGFVMSVIRWKRRDLGNAVLGFGLLFMGLDLLTKSMPALSAESLAFLGSFSGSPLSIAAGAAAGTLITLITHSSSASTAIVLTMAHQNMVSYELAASMILGANIGTTIDAALASLGAKPAARQAALVHVLFNVIGTVWALIFFHPLLNLVSVLTPGESAGAGITNQLAMFHTIFNTMNTLLFFPLVKPFAALVGFLIKDKAGGTGEKHYRIAYSSGAIQNSPEFNILRAEKEIRGMAGIVSSMYAGIGELLLTLKENPEKEKAVDALAAELKEKEAYADEMREELTHFLIECTRQQLNYRSERKVSRLLRIVADLENMTDDCYGVGLLLCRSVKKDQIFKGKEMAALAPYTDLVGDFLNFVRNHLGEPLRSEDAELAALTEERIDRARDKLRKYGRKRIEAGEDVKTELLFIDLVRRLEQLGDYCYSISAALSHLED
ncbi:MAG: Na/Pi cotransporter family protein [Treponema sp.]|jgi:phosphate:Na+ symporter|nr:Na/Pi cotransporter family protein [Treponema sp.]